MALRARDIMTTRVVTVNPDDTVAVAVHKMTELRFSALPVIDRRFRLVGMISLLDVLRHREDGGSDTTKVGAVTRSDLLRARSRPGPLGRLAQRFRRDDFDGAAQGPLPGRRTAPAHPG